MITIGVIESPYVHRVDLSEHRRNIYQRQIARRRDSARRHHLAEITFGDGVRRTRAEQQSHNTIDGRRRTATLRVANNYQTRIVARITRNSPRQNFSDTPKPRGDEGDRTDVYDYQLTIF